MELTEPQKKWIAALRSGEYEQTVGCLAKLNGEQKLSHCCLGVAAEIFKDELELNITELYNGYISYDGEDVVMPQKVQEYLNLKDDEGKIDGGVELKDGKSRNYLSGINDSGKFNFNEIADIIEHHADKLFKQTENTNETK